MATVETLLTAQEYYLRPDNGQPTELVRGRVVTMNMPAPRHGCFCGLIARLLGNHAHDNNAGRIMTNDSGVVTENEPDTVRGADVAFYSYQTLPKGPLPEGYVSVAPDLIFEVRSPGDRWKEIQLKVSEYLNAGVKVVAVHDAQTEKITVSTQDAPPLVLTVADELTFPTVLPGFRCPVRVLFE
jgi:Uma2 family endonuclease